MQSTSETKMAVKPKNYVKNNKKKAYKKKKSDAGMNAKHKTIQMQGTPQFIMSDSRLARNDVPRAATPKMVVQSTDKSITALGDMLGSTGDPGPLKSLALGIVLTSLRRGWSANLEFDQRDFPYNAYVYLVQSFVSAAQGTTSTLTVAPTWYWYLLDAIAPTTVKYKTGSVDYSWTFPQDASYVPDANVTQGQPNVVLGWVNPSQPEVDGFPTITLGVYDPVVAGKAIQSLFTLYSEDGPMLKRIPRKVTSLQLDVSAFATVYPEFGGSGLSPGAYATSLQSEVYIDCPILAKFAYYNYTTFRGVTHVARSSGTPCYVCPRMMEMNSPGALKNKVPPTFKFYNFDEFFEVLSLTLARAMEITAANNAQQPVLSCPLSSQAAQILLRQSIIPRFCNNMAQDLQLTGPSMEPCYPFSVGTNGCSNTMASVPMKLPQLLAENIRACDRRLTYLKNNDHQVDLVPILGRYDYSPLGNYVTAGGVSVYTDVPGELPIDLVSMSAQIPSGTVYIDGNGAYLTGLAVKFNEWITTLGAALSPLTNHAEENGIRALSTIVNTLHTTVRENPDPLIPQPNAKQLAKRASVVNLGKKIDVARKVGVSAGPVDPDTWTRLVSPVAFTSTYAPLTPIYKYLKLMVLPTTILKGDHYQSNIDLQQVNQIEPFRINEIATSDQYRVTDAMSLLERHLLMAEQDVRVNLAPTTEFQTELDELTKSGRGGFFTDIAGMIAGDVFHIPGAKQIASTIGAITGL